MNYAIKHRKTKRGIEGEIPEVTILGTDRRRTAPILPLPSLSKMIEPQPFEEYAKNYFLSILGIPQLPAPHQLIPGGFLPMYEDGTEGDEPPMAPDLGEVVIMPRKRSKYSIPSGAVAQPSDVDMEFGDTLTKDLILDDIYTSNPANVHRYQQEVYKRKKGVDWDADKSAYYTWLGKKPFLRSKTRRQILEDKYKTHVDKAYGRYAQDVADAINYVNGYFKSPQYADRMRGYDIDNPINGVAEGRKFLSQYAINGTAAWEYDRAKNANTFYIPQDLPGWEDVYKNTSYDPFFTAAHEYAHYMQAKTRGHGKDAFNDREKRLFDRRLNVISDHDLKYNENYADLIATRADMYRRGLVKDPYGEVSPEAIKLYREQYGQNNRFFNMYGDDDIRAMYNTIAYNPYNKGISYT